MNYIYFIDSQYMFIFVYNNHCFSLDNNNLETVLDKLTFISKIIVPNMITTPVTGYGSAGLKKDMEM